MHSGKSSVRDILVRDYGFYHEAFANPVKDVSVRAINFISNEIGEMSGYTFSPQFTRHQVDNNKGFFRPVPQFVGKMGRHYFGENAWVFLLGNRIEGIQQDIVVDDLRFPNEEAYLRGCGFTIIKMWRPYGEREDSIATDIKNKTGEWPTTYELEDIMSHESEIGVDDVREDVTLKNDGSLEDLEEEVRLFLDRT
jgi:hypothetical protein